MTFAFPVRSDNATGPSRPGFNAHIYTTLQIVGGDQRHDDVNLGRELDLDTRSRWVVTVHERTVLLINRAKLTFQSRFKKAFGGLTDTQEMNLLFNNLLH